MKIYFKRHDGDTEFHFHREPMEADKFYALWIALCVMVVAISFFGLFK